MKTYQVSLDYTMIGIEAENEEDAKAQLLQLIKLGEIDTESLYDHMESEEVE